MPDIFIGTDIISVPRIKKSIESATSNRFLHRLFTKFEIEYCYSKSNPAVHFAGRFAAKEAITKAILSSKKLNFIKMKSIEILAGNIGQPEVNLKIDTLFKYKCKVSISHCEEFATAFSLFEI